MDENQTESQSQKKFQKNPKVLAGIAAGVIVAVGGLVLMRGNSLTGSKNVQGESAQSVGQTEVEDSDTPGDIDEVGEAEDSEIRIIDVEAGSFYFKPNEIRVKKGEAVKIVMSAKDQMHDFNVDELGIKIPITKAGDKGEVDFVIEKTGTFEYYCSVGNHRKQGQVGKLIVE